MKRRWLTHRSIAAAALLGLGLEAACGLDANGLGSVSADGSAGGTASAPVGDATATFGDGSGGASPGSGGSLDGATATDGASGGDPGDPSTDAEPADVHVLDPDAAYEDSGDPCDLDQDGYKATGSCGGTDCCDYDSRANPGDTAFYSSPDACGSFDYNCNGKDDAEYAKAGCQLGWFVCSGSGFAGNPPACGASAAFDTCAWAVVTCSTTASSVAQACK